MEVSFRPYEPDDFMFVRELYFQTMRSAIERIFGWKQPEQEASFEEWFRPSEASIVLANGGDVGWVQQREENGVTDLGSIYIVPEMQNKGIGTWVIQHVLRSARERGQAVTLGVMKDNPAVGLYKRLGFRVTHEDDVKFYMRAAG